MRKMEVKTVLNIRNLRKEKNLKQMDLAQLVGIKSNTLSQYETGERVPNIVILKKLANILECTVDDLVKDYNEKEKEK